MAYSYHTFTLPFVWKGEKTEQSDLIHISRCFDQSNNWIDANLRDGFTTGKAVQARCMEDACTFYKEYQYFSHHVHNALYGLDNSVVRIYTFLPEEVQNNGHYYIVKGATTYDLLIKAITLRIYNTGVALFIMECENQGMDMNGNPQNTLAAVKNINDYGRRINLPLIPNTKSGVSLCADKLIVQFGNMKYETDFMGYVDKLQNATDLLQHHSMSYIGNHIKGILSSGSEFHFTTDDECAKKEKEALLIYPALDDRMFVSCYVYDPQEANKILLPRDKNSYSFEVDESSSKSLYEFIFIDPNDGCTCMSGRMRRMMLETHVYARWLDSGSIYGIAAQSFMQLTNYGAPQLLESFLTKYIRMSSLALVQRASLMLFERELADITVDSAIRKSRKMKRRTIVKIMDIRERYITYQSQLGFTEISSQEQGIEMWDMLRDSFQLQKQTDAFSKRMDDLQDAANTSLNFSINVIGLVFTLFSAIGIISGLIGYDPHGEVEYFWSFFNLNSSEGFYFISPKAMYILLHVTIYGLAFLIIKCLYRRRK